MGMSDPGNSGQAESREVLAASVAGTVPVGAPSLAAAPRESGNKIVINLVVNGEVRVASVDVRTSLLDLLREHLALFGAKKGCGHGQCGACTVHLDARRVVSCLTLAAQASGRQVTTIEGIASGDDLHPMQQAFVDHEALQCGYCTPGQIMSAIACVQEGHAQTPEQIREYMSGNLCRCGAYVGIVAAIQEAAPKMEA